MGPYCQFCHNRCFVPFPYRTPDEARKAYAPTVTIIATCPRGQAYERATTGGWCYDKIKDITERAAARQYEIDTITFEYATAYRAWVDGEPGAVCPNIDHYTRAHPEYAADILEFALYLVCFGLDHNLDEQPVESQLSPAAEKAMARIREMYQQPPVSVQDVIGA